VGQDQVDLDTFLEEGIPEPDDGVGQGPPTYVSHPMIEPETLEERTYQVELAQQARGQRTVVVLPTGLGKTIVAALLAAEVLQSREGKVVFLAPTRPLVQQHEETFGEQLRARDQVAIGGSISPARRAELFEDNRVVFSTPQGMRNDLEEGRISLDDVGLVIVDEAHRAVGDYAYVDIGQRYRYSRPEGTLLGLTASPGGDEARIQEVVDNLGIHEILSRDAEDPDVKPYVKDTKVRWVQLQLTPRMEAVRARLQNVVDERAEPLKKARYLEPKPYVSRTDAIDAGKQIRAELDEASENEKGPLFGLLLNQGVVMQALHCLELVETQGVKPLQTYLSRLMQDEDPSRSAEAFAKDPKVTDVWARIQDWPHPSHPKIDALVKTLNKELTENPDGLVIVFAQYRDTIASILDALDEEGIEAEKFVGQSDREGDAGMSQAEQKQVLDRMREGEFRVLVASSVAEEGLDIPSVDLVVFYEPVPSEIRLIQRRGRTGRQSVGRMVVLITEDTRDEAYMHAAMNREKKMRRLVRDMGD
jgi:Fanconi anemia group M protein